MEPIDAALLILRVGIGLVFAAHGAQKAFGWWEGPGFAGWSGAMARMRLRPALFWAVVSIGAELGAGLALAIGVLTPFAAAILIGQSIVIVLHVHLPKGFWNRLGGIEFPLVLGAGALTFAGVGPGASSVDRGLGFAVDDPIRWLALIVGALGGVVAVGITRLAAGRETAPQPR